MYGDRCTMRTRTVVPPQASLTGAEAEMVWEPGRRQERLDTALAYERMAERAKHHVALAK